MHWAKVGLQTKVGGTGTMLALVVNGSASLKDERKDCGKLYDR